MSGDFRGKIAVNLIVFLIISVLSVFSNAAAEDNSTFKDLGLYGGQVSSVAVVPDNSSIVFAGTWMGGGLFKSIDAGLSWTVLPGFKNIAVVDIAIDPNKYVNGMGWQMAIMLM